MPINFGKQMAMNTMAGKGNKTDIALNEICFRAENKYINNAEEAKSILESIRNEGLIEPITIVEIDEFLKNSDVSLLSDKHRDYYEKKRNEGFKYFISTGHRRYRAYGCLALGVSVFPNEDEFYQQFKKVKDASDQAFDEGRYEDTNKYCSIRCFVSKDDVRKERQRYNSSNLEQRRITDFEIVDNVIDDLKMFGIWDEWTKEYPSKYVDNLSDRSVTLNYKSKMPNEPLPNTIQEQREALKLIPAEELHGFQTYMNNKIIDYVSEKKSKKLSLSSVKYSRGILDNLGPRFDGDSGLIELIYSGDLEYKNARGILSYFDRIDDENWIRLEQTIKEHRFNSRTAERDFAEGIISSSGVEIENKLTKKEILKKLYKIKSGKLSIEELIAELEK